jgi:CheY-like chemotaxis protein
MNPASTADEGSAPPPAGGQPPPPRPSSPPAEMPPRRALRLLVADDTAINLTVLTRLLQKAGHQVHAVTNGRLVLEALAREQFDALLIDVQMPEMDGLEATRAIRASEVASGLRMPIIMVTAQAMATDHARCLAAGADAYITKPIRPALMFAAVARLTGAAAPDKQGAAGEPVGPLGRP